MLERKEEEIHTKVGVWIEEREGGRVVISRFSEDEPYAKVYKPLDSIPLGEVFRLVERIYIFETTEKWASEEEHLKFRLQTLLIQDNLRKIAKELEPIDFSLN